MTTEVVTPTDDQTKETAPAAETVTPPTTSTTTEEVPNSQATPADQSADSEAALAKAADTIEEYELAKSDNSKLSDEDFDSFIKEAEEKGYSKEIAEAVLKAKEEAAAQYSDEKWTNKGLEDLKKATHEQLSKDEMFNTPEKFKAAIEDAGLVFSHFGDADLKEAFKNPIIGSNPALFKFVLKIAKVMKSEGVEVDLTNGNPSGMDRNGQQPKTFLDTLYPDM